MFDKIKSPQQKLSKEANRTMSDKIIQLNEDLIKYDLKELVRNSVEEPLNTLLDKQCKCFLCQAIQGEDR